MIEVFAFPRWKIENYTSDIPYVLIAFRDPYQSLPSYEIDPHRQSVIAIRCNDITEPIDRYFHFTSQQAEQIAQFVQTWFTDGVTRFVVHCEGGISRSPGCAKALAEAYGGQRTNLMPHQSYNPLIYRETLVACQNILKKEAMCV